MVSLVVARLFGLPEAYWAPVTTLVITQSSLRETLSLSWHRFMGTALGALVGVIVAIQIGPNLLAFGAGVLVLGLLCALVGSDRTAYRFGAVTLAIVLLVPRTNSAWHMAFHRFAGVSLGIGVALVLTVLWPESEDFPQEGMGFVQPNDSVTTGLQEGVGRTAAEVARRKFSPES
jgi:uncharacterized membrane protein YgaE (UPF0421/DUF939 family)